VESYAARTESGRRSPTRVLFLGFDACDPRTVQDLAAAGHLPTFSWALAQAARARVLSPVGVYEGATWGSFLTGNSPAGHRYWNWEEIAAGTYERRETHVRELRGTPFWDALSAAGKRVAVLDVPHARPSNRLCGLQLCEWGAHDLHVGLDGSPDDLVDDVLTRFGPYPVQGRRPDGSPQVAPDDYAHRTRRLRTVEELCALRDDLLEGARRKRSLSLHYLAQGGWDLYVSVFGEPHMVGHQCWHLHDVTHPRFEPALRDAVGDPVADVYREMDDALGRHLELVDADTTVLVYLSHGMGRHVGGQHLLDPVLARLDERGPGGARAARLAKTAWGCMPLAWRRRAAGIAARTLRRRYQRLERTRQPTTPLAARRWFQTPNNHSVGGVRFNVVGREPRGLVRPGRELGDAYRRVTRGLLGLVNVETGSPPVRRVVRCGDIYERSALDSFPDLFVEWDLTEPIETIWSHEVGVMHVPDLEWRTGDHTSPDGLLLAFGPGLTAGTQLPALRVEDLAPTMTALLAVELAGVSGRPASSLTSAVSAL
jgi:predicted AlkP superfamily phosphohydrolase/phosphomutase